MKSVEYFSKKENRCAHQDSISFRIRW